MNKTILIPMIGTVAALIAVLLSHGEKEHASYPLKVTLPEPKPPPKKAPVDPSKEKKKQPAPAPRATRYLMEVKEGGSFVVTAVVPDKTKHEPLRFASLEEMLDKIAPEGGPKPRIHLFATASTVSKADVEKVAARLKDRCDVVIQARAGEEEKK